jgi:AbrB family looped-hinge helix DNA binding protein
MDKGIVTTKGQLVIPARLRRRLGIRKGTIVSFQEEAGRLIVQPVTPDFIDRLKGSLPGGARFMREFLEGRRKDRSL